MRSGVPVRFGRREWGKDRTEYVVVFCRFKSEHEAAFLECMADLERAMILEGETDYRDACEQLAGIFSES